MPAGIPHDQNNFLLQIKVDSPECACYGNMGRGTCSPDFYAWHPGIRAPYDDCDTPELSPVDEINLAADRVNVDGCFLLERVSSANHSHVEVPCLDICDWLRHSARKYREGFQGGAEIGPSEHAALRFAQVLNRAARDKE